jgi:hypothetical protein
MRTITPACSLMRSIVLVAATDAGAAGAPLSTTLSRARPHAHAPTLATHTVVLAFVAAEHGF